MNNLKDLTVIIVTFKTNEEILFNCLDSIKKEVKILLVENSSNQEFKKKIENKYNNVNVILSGKNLGYGGGNNLGLKNTKTRFALISNPDVEYNKNFFDEIFLKKLFQKFKSIYMGLNSFQKKTFTLMTTHYVCTPFFVF